MSAERSGPPGLMSVRAELVRDHLVNGIRAAVRDHAPASVPPALRQGMSDTFDLVSESDASAEGSDFAAARIVAAKLAHLGWVARACEVEMFEPARRPFDLTPAGIGQSEVPEGESPLVTEAARLARVEPDRRPDPGDGTASWRIPGPGGHVRHYVAMETVAEHCDRAEGGPPRPPAGVALVELKRCWMFGLILGALQEMDDAKTG